MAITLAIYNIKIYLPIQLSIWKTSYIQHFSDKWTICSPRNFLYLSQVCFLIVGSSLHAACVIEHSFLSLTFLLQNLLCWPFFRKIWKLFLVAHFGVNFIVYILVGYSLFMLPSKERFKGICPVVNLCEFFRQKPLSDFFAKRTPKKNFVWFSDFRPGNHKLLYS